MAKNVIQLSVVSPRGKELINRSFTRCKFAEFLGKQGPSLVAFESCASAHYWARAAKRHGHEARIIPAKAVAPFRQSHKTDSNDALAVAEAARRPNIKEAPMKTAEQQGLQAIQRSRELLISECTALSNHLRGLLLEFGVAIPQGFASLLRALPEIHRGWRQRADRPVSTNAAQHASSIARTTRRHRVDDQGDRRSGKATPGLQTPHCDGRHWPDRCTVTLCCAWLWQGLHQEP